MDKIQYGCTLCGECCSGSMQVFINSYDIYKMGRFLKMENSSELFERRLLMLDKGQNDLLLPRIRFKTKPFSFCPFLINDFDEEKGLRGFCSLHLLQKPLVCRLAPLVRRIDLEKDSDEFDFILPHSSCPGKEQNEVLDPQKERQELSEELDYELRYYRLLSAHEDDPAYLWNFPLNKHKNFEEILKEWEDAE